MAWSDDTESHLARRRRKAAVEVAEPQLGPLRLGGHHVDHPPLAGEGVPIRRDRAWRRPVGKPLLVVQVARWDQHRVSADVADVAMHHEHVTAALVHVDIHSAGRSAKLIHVTGSFISAGPGCVQTHADFRTPAHVARRAARRREACRWEERASLEECGEDPHLVAVAERDGALLATAR